MPFKKNNLVECVLVGVPSAEAEVTIACEYNRTFLSLAGFIGAAAEAYDEIGGGDRFKLLS